MAENIILKVINSKSEVSFHTAFILMLRIKLLSRIKLEIIDALSNVGLINEESNE